MQIGDIVRVLGGFHKNYIAKVVKVMPGDSIMCQGRGVRFTARRKNLQIVRAVEEQ